MKPTKSTAAARSHRRRSSVVASGTTARPKAWSMNRCWVRYGMQTQYRTTFSTAMSAKTPSIAGSAGRISEPFMVQPAVRETIQRGTSLGSRTAEQDIAQRPPIRQRQVVGTGPHRLGTVPAGQQRAAQHPDFQRIEGIAGEQRVANEPVSSDTSGTSAITSARTTLVRAGPDWTRIPPIARAIKRRNENDPDGLGSQGLTGGQCTQNQRRVSPSPRANRRKK